MSERVTIKTIARDLGISHMTVSRALSNHPKVRESTRIAVQERARELGYVKSAAAMTIRGDKAKIVGLLVPNLLNEFYARYSNKFAELCNAHGWQPIIHVTNDNITREQRAILKLREIQAGAVVMVPAPVRTADQRKYLRDLQVIQLIRQTETATDSGAILVDDTEAIKHAVSHLVRLGHRRIAYIGGAGTLSTGRARLEAFVAGMEMAGIELVEELVYTDAPSFDLGFSSARTLISGGNCSAILCGGFEISNGALYACLENGISIPEDISFIGYGDPSFYRWIGQGISTINVPVEDLAASSVKMLKKKWSGETTHLENTVLTAEFIKRN